MCEMAPFAAWGTGRTRALLGRAFGVGLQRCQELCSSLLSLGRLPAASPVRSGGDGSPREGRVTRVLQVLCGEEQMGAAAERGGAGWGIIVGVARAT